jgi:hypothetical protein
VNPVPDPLLFRKSDSAGNRTRDLWDSSQELWSLDHRGGSSRATQCLIREPRQLPKPDPESLILKMATEMFEETLESSYSRELKPHGTEYQNTE